MKSKEQKIGAQRWGGLRKLSMVLVGASLLGAAGCNRTAGPPPPLPAEQIPAELQKAFAQAGPEVKNLIAEIERTLGSKDHPAAYQRVQLLCNLPEATKDQRLVSTRAMLTLTTLLQAAQAQGDQDAAAALKLQQRTR